MTRTQVLKLIESEISLYGSAKELAKRWDLSPQYLSDVRAGRRYPGHSILDRLGLEVVVAYQRKPCLARGEGPRDETPETVAAWADSTFGSATLQRQFDRALEEMQELAEVLDNPEQAAKEAADVVICLYRIIRRKSLINEKMQINRARQWKVGADGCAYHVKPGE